MLQILDRWENIDFAQLNLLYSETIARLESDFGIRDGCSAFLLGFRDFLSIKDAYLGVWLIENSYVCGVRVEPYRDGYLLSWLETYQEKRNMGYAKKLVSSLSRYMLSEGQLPLYAHIKKDNLQSLRTFVSCGFTITGNPAVFLDGSASSAYHTLCFDGK